MIKTIIVSDEAVHEFLSGRYPNWDTQVPVTSVEALWDGLSAGTLSAESEIVIFSDQYRDPNNQSEELEIAIATLAPNALVMVITYDESSFSVLRERVRAIANREGLEPAKIYFVDPSTPEDDIDVALNEYAAKHGDESEDLAPQVAKDNTPVAETQSRSAHVKRNGMIIVSTSSKGGSGKSTTALLLASQLARGSQKSVEEGKTQRPLDVCVVDMDIRDGQIGFLIGQMRPTALNIRVLPEWTPDAIRQNLVYDARLGIHALLAPKRPRTSEDTPPEFYKIIINELRGMFDVVILDTSVNYLDPLLEDVCYPIADAILFVTDLGLSSVFGMARWFQETTSSPSDGGMGLNTEKIGIVVNKSMTGVHMDRERVKNAAMDAPLLAAVPSRPVEFYQAANKNRLDILLEDPEIGNSFYRLARRILGNKYPLSPLVEGEVNSLEGNGKPPSSTPTTSRTIKATPVGGRQYQGYKAPGDAQSTPRKRGLFGRR